MARDHVRPQPRALVVAPSSAARTARAQTLEEQGFAVLEATDVDEACWALVAARAGDTPPLEVVVADLSTPGLQRLLGEVRAARPAPALVLVAARPSDVMKLPAEVLRAGDPRLAGAEVVPGAVESELRDAVQRALRRRERDKATLRVLVALASPPRRAAVRAALGAARTSVVAVADGLELLEVLGANLALAPVAWAPEVLVLDARLERLDGLDALAEVRELDLLTPVVVLVHRDDLGARARAERLRATVVDADADPADLVRVVVEARPPARRVARPLRAG